MKTQPEDFTKAERPRVTLGRMAHEAGCFLTSIGDIERLAGIDTYDEAARKSLWDGFRHLYAGPSQVLIDAVMDHCAAIAIRRINAGELCFFNPYRTGAVTHA